MLRWIESIGEHDGHISVKKLLDLDTPRSVRASWLKTADGRDCRVIKRVWKVVKEDGPLFSFYDYNGDLIDRVAGVAGDELEVLTPGFSGGIRIL